MYRVVGCNECSALWVLPDDPDTSQCPRCRKRHQVAKLKAFHRTDDEDEAREFRAAMLAERQGESDAFAEMDHFAALEAQADAAGVDDEEYLEASGVDPDEAAAAERRAEQGRSGGSQSQKEVVLAALREQNAPSERDVVTYAEARGVPAKKATKLLTKLEQAGDVSLSGGTYRLL